MNISYNWLRELTGVDWSPEELRERFTMAGLEIESLAKVGSDYVFEIAVLSNRADLFSHLGVAREVGVMTWRGVQLPPLEPVRVAGRAEDFTSVEVQAPDLCPRFTARVVRDVKIGPSPEWLAERLRAVGLRPINNVADITNFVMLELGQPLHAFDLDLLTERRLVVRHARRDERITTLDGAERKLDPEMLVIADATRAVAVAGVMGGAETEISGATRNVLIECAYFTPASIRHTARSLELQTDASDRFERGVDPEGLLRAQARTVALITKLAGGAATEDAIDVYSHRAETQTISLRPARIGALTGLEVAPQESLRILQALGFTPFEGGAKLSFHVPTWRRDVSVEEDLVEEVARHYGYEKIEAALPATVGVGEHRAHEERRRAARRALASLGFDEAISFSFIDAAHDDRFDLIPGLVAAGPYAQAGDEPHALSSDEAMHDAAVHFGEAKGSRACDSADVNVGNRAGECADSDARFVTLTNPIIEGASRMRPTLLPGLLAAVRHNFNHGTRDVRLFESGRVFATAAKAGARPVELESLGLVATGSALEEGRAAAPRELDFYDLKGALEAAVDAIKLPPLDFAAADARHLRAGQSARVSLGARPVGWIGRLDEGIAAAYKFRQPVYIGEVNLSVLLESEVAQARYTPLARFPSVVRDASLLVDRRATFTEMRRTVIGMNLENVRGVELVYVYEGERLPEGKRSVTLRVEYRSDQRTLRDEEADALHRQIVAALESRFGAQLR